MVTFTKNVCFVLLIECFNFPLNQNLFMADPEHPDKNKPENFVTFAKDTKHKIIISKIILFFIVFIIIIDLIC